MNRSSQFFCSVILGSLLTFCLVSRVSADGVYERLRSFGFPEQSGQTPSSALIQSNGLLYGTASSGGLITGGGGVVYRINEDGSGYTLLHTFSSTTNGNSPAAPLIFGSDGALYGTTSTGSGQQKSGVVFKVAAQGGGYQELHTFGASLSDGAIPRGGLVKGLDSALYGVTLSGGLSSAGVIYKLQESGADYQVLHHFTRGLGGERPAGELFADGTGWLYGVTEAGGTTNRASHGTIFRINENGSGFTTLFVFNGTNGSQPRTTLRRAPNNSFYGVARGGGAANKGVVFRINADGSDFSVLHDFMGGPADGSSPVCAPVLGPDGLLYGATSGGGTNSYGVLYRVGLDGNNFEVLTQLPPSSGQNENFASSLLLGSDGKWRGVTSGGGGENFGTFYRVNLNGTDLAVLRHFTSKGGDARGAAAGLIRASDGYFYGTGPGGGISNAGAIFRFSEGALNYAIVHSFATNEGSAPNDLIEAQPGLLFGTTSSGGQFNKGTVFRMETNGANFSVLHHFAAGGLGERPLAGLFLANDGRLYGTTTRGSTTGFGTIYRLFPDGSGFEVVYSFCCGTGYTPICSLVQGTNGMLYGTADDGGNFGRGVVFRVNLDGSDYTVLHHFAADGSEGGGFPVTGLVIGPDQALYGTTAGGPVGGLFKLNQDGSNFTMLRVFSGSEGRRPAAPVHFGPDNVIYGTTQFGGTFGGQGGTVFRMNLDGSGFAVLHSFAFPVGPEGARSTAGVVAGADGWLYGVTPLGGDFSDGVVYRVHPAVTTNYAPTLTSALSDYQLYIHGSLNYGVSSGLFFDRDWGQTLTWTATGMPPGVVFNPTNLTITGTPTVVGNFDITVTATDNGSPPAVGTEVFQVRVLVPDIAIVRSGTNILVHWPRTAIGFQLQETDMLGPNAVWNSLGLPGGYDIGNRRYAVYPLKPGKWFYRLAEY